MLSIQSVVYVTAFENSNVIIFLSYRNDSSKDWDCMGKISLRFARSYFSIKKRWVILFSLYIFNQ